MKYFKFTTIILGILFVVTGCNKENIETKEPRLTSSYAKYLLLTDDLGDFSNSGFSILPKDTPAVLSFIYQNDQIIRVNGGLFPAPSGSDFSNSQFSLQAYDSITYLGNQVSVYPRFYLGDSIVDKVLSPMVYVLGSDQRLDKIILYNNFNHEAFMGYTFSYTENKITETNSLGFKRRQFFFENGNLTRVLKQLVDSDGNVVSEDEILFEDYDDHPNPFRNLYYINGAFYRAFSKNNYKKYIVNHYGFLNDGTYGLMSTRWDSYQFTYNADGYPMFGDYN